MDFHSAIGLHEYTHTHAHVCTHSHMQANKAQLELAVGSALQMSGAFQLMMDYGCVIVLLLAQVLFASSLQFAPIDTVQSSALGTWCWLLSTQYSVLAIMPARCIIMRLLAIKTACRQPA